MRPVAEERTAAVEIVDKKIRKENYENMKTGRSPENSAIPCRRKNALC